MEICKLTKKELLDMENPMEALNLLILVGPDNYDGDIEDYERLEKTLAKREVKFIRNKMKEEEFNE